MQKLVIFLWLLQSSVIFASCNFGKFALSDTSSSLLTKSTLSYDCHERRVYIQNQIRHLEQNVQAPLSVDSKIREAFELDRQAFFRSYYLTNVLFFLENPDYTNPFIKYERKPRGLLRPGMNWHPLGAEAKSEVIPIPQFSVTNHK